MYLFTPMCLTDCLSFSVCVHVCARVCLCVTRFMATNDLMLELQKDSMKLDEDSERKVVNMLLKLLEDKNGEVQNLAVKW